MKARSAKLKWYFYLPMVALGLLLFYIASLLQHPLRTGENPHYLSGFLASNYTWLSISLLFVAGFLIGYFLKVNFWFAGLALFAIFPVTSVVEAFIIRGSHNLIPFELVFQFIMSLPTVFAVFLGAKVSQATAKKVRIEK
ncbi:MAG: hypothetical protein ACO1OO_06850 [Flavisolibacter sp.]